MPFPSGPGGKWQISKAGGSLPRWSRDGKEIFFISQEPRPTLYTAKVDAQGAAIRVLDVRPLFPFEGIGARSAFAPSLDGQRFLVNVSAAEASKTSNPATVVVDWLAAQSTR